MARPREFDLDVVAEGLLQTFWSRGFAGTSVSDLSTATLLGPGSLYAAFGDKEAMFRVAADRYRAKLGDALASKARGLEGLRALFQVVVRLTVNDPARRGCLIINAIPESSGLSDETRQYLREGLLAFRQVVRERLLEAAEDARADDRVDIDALTAVLSATAIGIRTLGRAGQSRRHLQSIANGVISLVEGCYAEASRP